MKYSIGVYGDSISFGYGNNDISWFDLLTGFKNKLKLSQNGETINNVLTKISEDDNTYETLIIAVGVNNFLQISPVADDSQMQNSMLMYENILKIALQKSDKVVLQNLLPVIENKFPNQKYLDDPKYIFNCNIISFNKFLERLSVKYGVMLIDAYTFFNKNHLDELYFDGVHPNEQGQILLLKIYQKELTL